MVPKHNEVAQRELDLMLKAEIISRSVSPSSFPIVISTKNEGKPSLCVDYRVLNWRMKADRFLLSKIQEIFDKL